MRVDPVVKASPCLDHDAGLGHAQKDLLIEAFVAQAVVEALMLSSGRTPSEHVAFGSCLSRSARFYMPVLPRTARIDIDGADTHLCEPVLNVPGHELGTVVATDVVRHAPLGHGLRQGVEHLLALELATHFDPEALPAFFQRLVEDSIFQHLVRQHLLELHVLDLEVDLSKFAGKSIDLIIENKANNWMNEFGYWGSIQVVRE
jgi:hypothetical protein